MGFMDKAKTFAEQAQKEAKDGTLKQRGKVLPPSGTAGDVERSHEAAARVTGGDPLVG